MRAHALDRLGDEVAADVDPDDEALLVDRAREVGEPEAGARGQVEHGAAGSRDGLHRAVAEVAVERRLQELVPELLVGAHERGADLVLLRDQGVDDAGVAVAVQERLQLVLADRLRHQVAVERGCVVGRPVAAPVAASVSLERAVANERLQEQVNDVPARRQEAERLAEALLVERPLEGVEHSALGGVASQDLVARPPVLEVGGLHGRRRLPQRCRHPDPFSARPVSSAAVVLIPPKYSDSFVDSFGA